MKSIHIFSIFVLLFVTNICSAQVPQGMNYQCALRDPNGEVLANYFAQMKFTIKRTGNVIAYEGYYYPTTNEFGMVNLTLGVNEDDLNYDYGTFAEIDWVNYNEWFLQVHLWYNGVWMDLGAQSILSVPYANHSATSKTATEMTLDKLTDVNYENEPNDGDKLVYSDYYAEWVPSSSVPNYIDDVWSTNGANTYLTTGPVGVGTDTPNSKLHVHDGSLRITQPVLGSGLLDGLSIGQDGSGNATFSNLENTDMVFSTAFTERFRLGANGPILPLNNPGHKFHIKSTFPGLGMHLTYTNTGHNETDGTKIGLNGSSQLEINQQENQDILFKRNGVTRATITNNGLSVNGGVVASAVNSTAVEAIGMSTTQMDTENLYIHSAEGANNRMIYVTEDGQVAALPEYAYYTIQPADLRPRTNCGWTELDDCVDFNIDEFPTYSFLHQESYDRDFIAPLHLPQGAQLIEMTVYFNDGSPDDIMIFRLSEYHVSTGESASLDGTVGGAMLNTEGMSGLGSVTHEFFDGSLSSDMHDVIDNSAGMYTFELALGGDSPLVEDQTNMKFHSAVIKYRILHNGY